MKVFVSVLFILLLNRDVDFHIALSYHAKLVKNKEWSIVVERRSDQILIKIENYQNRHITAKLHRDEYIKLLEFLNKAGVWNLKSNYPTTSSNAYYKIEVQQGKYAHVAIVEAGPLLSGEASRFREIIRKLENLAKAQFEK